ncbi:uncharacterized mitochondrial protein-like protein [Tanacetum coccineum]
MNKEIQALKANHTWDITTLPPRKLLIRSTWVFRIKFKADGDIDRFKARVVAKGFNKKECNDTVMIKHIKQQINLTFSIKDLRSLHYYLGIKILQNSTVLVMSQRKYALDLLQSTSLLNHKPSTIPMNLIKTLNATNGIPLADPSHYTPYYEGSYERWKVLDGVRLQEDDKEVIEVLEVLDIDGIGGGWVSSFTLEMQVTLHNEIKQKFPCKKVVVISWTSKKQSVVSKSSIEAEYKALADCTCEISWLQCLFKDLQVQLPNPVLIYYDNASAIALASNPIHHAMT